MRSSNYRINKKGAHAGKMSWQRMPLSKCVISIVLTITLVLGFGTNLSYAAEFLPDGPQIVTMTNAETKTLVAPASNYDQANYTWEMFSNELGDFAQISGETGSTLKVDPGYFGEEATSVQIKCTVSDANSSASTSQVYNVNLIRENANLGDSLAAATANEEGATTSDITLGDPQDPEVNEVYTVAVNYTNMDGTVLATPTKVDFTESTPFSWKLQVKNFLGTPKEYTINPATGSGITVDLTDGILINSTAGISAAVSVTVKFDIATANYTVDCYDQNTNGSYPSVPSRTFTKSGTIGTDFPTTEAEAKEYIPAATGWGLAKFFPTTITFDGSSHCSIAFYRTFSLVSFDTDGGKHGPAAIFARYGTTYDKPSDPDKAGYIFKGWKDSSGTILKDYVVPAVSTTYTAVWQASGQTKANVYLVYWGEDANHPDGTPTYSYLTENRDQGTIGQKYVLPSSRYNPGVTDIQRTEYNLKYKVTSKEDITYDSVTVTADGYSIVNIYLLRKTFQWDFRSNGGGTLYGSIKARWDQDIHAQFVAINKIAYPSATDWDSGMWIVNTDGYNTTYVNLLTNMSTVNHTGTESWSSDTCAFRAVTSRFDSKVYFNYFLQKLDGDYSTHGSVKVTNPDREETNFINWKKVLMDDREPGGWGWNYMNFTEDEWIPIEGFTAPGYYDETNSPGVGNHVGWTNSSDNKRYGYGIFYKRNKFDIGLVKVTGTTEERPYEALLSDVYYEKCLADVPIPTSLQAKGTKIDTSKGWTLGNFRPNNPGGAIDKNLVFDGWTFAQDGQGETVDLENETMPNSGINLYAKWVDPVITVKFVAPMDPLNNEPTEAKDIDPAYSATVNDVLYNTKVDPSLVPNLKVFKDGSGDITYDAVARYYYEDETAKTGKTYWNPYDMLAPGHDITVYTEYENVKTVPFIVKYELEDKTPVAADRTEFAYLGDTVTVIAKQQNELYFDYRAMYVPNDPQQNVKIDKEGIVVTFTYHKDDSIKLNYHVYHVIKDLLPPGWEEGDDVTGKALLQHDFVQGVDETTVEVNALTDNPYGTLCSDCPTKQTIVLSKTEENKAYFYYEEKTVQMQFKMVVDGNILEPAAWPEDYSLTPVTQDVKILSGTVGCTLTTPGLGEDYTFANWTTEGSALPVSTDKILEITAGNEPWVATTYYANLFTTRIDLKIVSDDETTGGIVPAQPAEPWSIPKGTAYQIVADTIYFSYKTTSDSCKAVGKTKDLFQYEFDYWTINGGTTHITSDSGTMTENTTFIAHFKNLEFDVTFHVKDGKGGDVSIQKTTVNNNTHYSVNANNELVVGTLPVAPIPDKDNHYHYVKWTLNNSTDPISASGGEIHGNWEFYAWFELDVVTLTFATAGNGTFKIGETTATTLDVPYGTTYAISKEDASLGKVSFTLPEGRSSITSLPEVTVTPDTGYKYSRWATTPVVAEGSPIANPEVFTVYFEILTYQVTFTATPAQGGTVQADATVFNKIPYGTAYEVLDGNMIVFNAPGSMVTFYATAVPNTQAHYEFISWDKGGSPVEPGKVTSNLTFNANFDLVVHTITFVTNPSNLGIVDQTTISAHHGSTWAVDGTDKNKVNVTEIKGGSQQSATATANEHVEFVDWYIDGSETPVSGIQTLESDITVVAKFRYVNVTVTLATANTSKGHVGHRQGTGDSVNFVVPYNSTFKITENTGYVQFSTSTQDWCSADPAEHYLYSFWGDSAESTATPLDEEVPITVTGDVTYYCHFKLVEYPVIFVNFYGSERGTIKDQAGAGDEVDEIWVPYGTDYLITEDSKTGTAKDWGQIDFTFPADNEENSNDGPDEQIRATSYRSGGVQYFWDGWYATWVDKELETGEIVQQRVFNAVFWQANDLDYGVAHMQQTIDPETGQVVEVASKEEAYQKWFMKDSQYNMTTTGAPDVTIPLNDYNYYNCIDTPETLHFTLESPAHQLVVYRYERQKFDVNITYVIEGDDPIEAPDPVEDIHAWGETYNYVSPVVEGYTPDITVVAGEMPTEDLNVVVTYTKTPEPEPTNPENINAQTGDNMFSVVGIFFAIVALAGVGIFANRRRTTVRGKHSIR